MGGRPTAEDSVAEPADHCADLTEGLKALLEDILLEDPSVHYQLTDQLIHQAACKMPCTCALSLLLALIRNSYKYVTTR